MSFFGGLFGGGRSRGIVAGDNPLLDEWLRKQQEGGMWPSPADMPDPPAMAPEPEQKRGGGIFGNGGLLGRSMDDWASRFGQAGAYWSGEWDAGAEIGKARNAARDAALAAQQKRQADWEDYQRRKQYDADLEARKPAEPPPQAKLTQWYMNATPEERAAFDKVAPVITSDWQGPHVLPRDSIGQQGGGNIPRITTPAERDALPPGAQYYAPDGQLRTKGGGGGDATGNFQLYPYGRRR